MAIPELKMTMTNGVT